eukprot:CAMPEP_0174239236 /NCGR_PEP_ID=MMETSP0417-20130205/13960_1 /TAXON_ID=242541 /ORGANISM="Mayorella sp, Strain BSH-02190019" /LENGTH=55 /DNA_ID=CAMNT_0015318155 /DNA_START=1 /DNA_END=164 /DNA_ORIENTATION=+
MKVQNLDGDLGILADPCLQSVSENASLTHIYMHDRGSNLCYQVHCALYANRTLLP